MMTSSKCKHFPCYWPFVRGIHRSPVNSPHKGPVTRKVFAFWWPVNSPHKGLWRGALLFSLICALNKQSWSWWFETPPRSLWRHCNLTCPWNLKSTSLFKSTFTITNTLKNIGIWFIGKRWSYLNVCLAGTIFIWVCHGTISQHKDTELCRMLPCIKISSAICRSMCYICGLFWRKVLFTMPNSGINHHRIIIPLRTAHAVMMTSYNGNIICVTFHLRGEFTGQVTGEFPTKRPMTQSFDDFFDLCLNKRLIKQSWVWWFETPSRSSWRHCNVVVYTHLLSLSVKFWCLILHIIGCVLRDASAFFEQSMLFATWWPHQIETFSALLALCADNSLVTGEFPSQRPVTRGFDVFFDLRLNKRLNKQSRRQWFETPSPSLWRHCNAIFRSLCLKLCPRNTLIHLHESHYGLSHNKYRWLDCLFPRVMEVCNWVRTIDHSNWYT